MSTLQIDGVTDEIAQKVGVTGDNILQKTRVTRQLHKRTSKKNFERDATKKMTNNQTQGELSPYKLPERDNSFLLDFFRGRCL